MHGVTGWDRVIQLIEVLLDEWKPWVESVATDFALENPDWDTPEEVEMQPAVLLIHLHLQLTLMISTL